MIQLLEKNHPLRLSRLRRTPALRALTRETRLHPADLVQPLIVVENEAESGPVSSMPNVKRIALGAIEDAAQDIATSGVRATLVFGVPAEKNEWAGPASDPEGVVPRAVRAIRKAAPALAIITDVCLCQSSSHGHCGVLDGTEIDLDATLARLGAIAISHAEAGADLVAPSAMVDGQVAAIRRALDGGGHERVGVLSYAVKQASAFYGPFRDAASSAPAFGDRRAHQMDSANAREAIAEAAQDVAEGADAIMVKPGGTNLDLIRAIRDASPRRPIAAYQVSGEYAGLCAAAAAGVLDERAAALETLTALKRAGAALIITYWAARAARWLRENPS